VKIELLAKGVDAAQARVIRTGLDMMHYPNGAERNGAETDEKPLRLLYAGRLVADKGVHIIIQAMDDLINRRGLAGQASLSLAGSGDPEYEAKLHALTAAMGLGHHISFLGRIPREEMPLLYQGHDLLVVPSLWPEPFARVLLEGMASGLAVIATGEGGTSEIIRDGQNGLLFATGEAHDLADKIVALHEEPMKRARLSAAARQTILQDYSEKRMLDEMESYLLEVLGRS
jgi:glycosyltransferase involved in cell wall biosynthesis